jgi:hypothetical protein
VLESEIFNHNRTTETTTTTQSAVATNSYVDIVRRYLARIHFLPTRDNYWWNTFNLVTSEKKKLLKMKSMYGMASMEKKTLRSTSSDSTGGSGGSDDTVHCTPERIVSFLKSKNVFSSPYEHVEQLILQRIVSSELSSSTTSTSSSTAATTASNSNTSSIKVMFPMHVQLFMRVAPSSTSLASLLRTYESIVKILTEDEDNNSNKRRDESLLHGQTLYMLLLLSDLSFNPDNNNEQGVLDFRTSVHLLHYVSAVVYEWCVESTTINTNQTNTRTSAATQKIVDKEQGHQDNDIVSMKIQRRLSSTEISMEMEDWKEKVKGKICLFLLMLLL